MADEEIEVEGKKKSPLIKIIVIALVAILVLVGTVVGTLFVTGFFDKKRHHRSRRGPEKPRKRRCQQQGRCQPSRRCPTKSGQRIPRTQAL